MDKLELKHLSCYLPYELRLTACSQPMNGRMCELLAKHTYSTIKPILRPLSDYYDINSPAMNDLNLDLGDQIWLVNLADGTYHVDKLPYRLACTLAEEHIDFMGLIPAGLALSYKEAGL